MKYRILIVEDNIMLAGQQKKRLEKSGYEAEITKNIIRPTVKSVQST